MATIGIDMIEIHRIEKSIKNGTFLKHVFSKEEYEQLKERNFSPQSVAINFCAKEAFLKCIGKGLGFSKFSDIQLLRENYGKPYLKLSGAALEFANKNRLVFSVSATHTKEYASVVVLAERKEEI